MGGLVFPIFGKRSRDTSMRKLGQPSPTQVLGLLRFSEKRCYLVARMHRRHGHSPEHFP